MNTASFPPPLSCTFVFCEPYRARIRPVIIQSVGHMCGTYKGRISAMKSRKQGLEVSSSPDGAVPDSQWVLLRTRARSPRCELLSAAAV